MSERLHCDHCDNVIPTVVTRMTLLCGTAKGRETEEEDVTRDYCQDCVQKIPLLRKIFAEVFAKDTASAK